MKREGTPYQAKVFAELSKGMNPVQKRELLTMLQQTDERFRPVMEANMIPFRNASSLLTAIEQVGVYRKKLVALTGGSDYAKAKIASHIQDVEGIKLAVTQTTGRPRGSISFEWAKRLALLKGNKP